MTKLPPAPRLVAAACRGKELARVVEARRAALEGTLPEKRHQRIEIERWLKSTFYASMSQAVSLAFSVFRRTGERKAWSFLRDCPRAMHDLDELLKGVRDDAVLAGFSDEERRDVREMVDFFVGLTAAFDEADDAEIDRDARHLEPVTIDASDEAAERARAIFRDATAEAFARVLASYRFRYVAAMKIYGKVRALREAVLPPSDIRYEKGFENTSSEDLFVLMPRIVGWNGKDLSESEIATRIEKAANVDAERALRGYVERGASKLAPALDGLGMNPEIDVEESDEGRLLERIMRFRFEDGTRFVMATSVEDVINRQGTQFLRFPCRFSEVVLPDGTKMKTPSAARISEVFGRRDDVHVRP